MYSFSFRLPNGVQTTALTSSSQLLIEAAVKLGLNFQIIEDTELIKFSDQKGQVIFFHGQTPSTTSYIGFYASENKNTCKQLLKQAGINVPKGYVVHENMNKDDTISIFYDLRKPLVVKPVDGMQGRNVFMNISDEENYLSSVKKCFEEDAKSNNGVLVEELFAGDEYRIVLSRKQVYAVIKRVPANITGDGEHSIDELIILKNLDPCRSDDHNDPITKIKVDQHVMSHLKNQKLRLTDIPKVGEIIYLRSNSNISTGGDSIDYTDVVHPSVKELALTAINAIPGLAFAGLDFISSDITAAQNQDSYCVIELNKSPGFSIHTYPFRGKSRPVAEMLLKELFSL